MLTYIMHVLYYMCTSPLCDFIHVVFLGFLVCTSWFCWRLGLMFLLVFTRLGYLGDDQIIRITDSLRGSSVKIGTIQGRLAWPLRKDDTHKSISVNIFV